MDPSRFDDLARVLSVAGGRRPLLGALVGVVLGSTVADAAARKRDGRKARGKGSNGDEDRESDGRLQAERRGKGGKRRKHKKKRGRNDNDGGQTPNPPPSDCCGTESCPDPEPGSTRSDCGFAGRSFTGEDLNGSAFRSIDGREANFDQTNNRGSIFADACLQGAKFRFARLDGSTWGGACLVGADFTGADLGGDSAVFAGARFCNTRMPDGSVNDRDCDKATPCCRPNANPEPDCESNADCIQFACYSNVCTNGSCVLTQVVSGPSPNDLCSFCCNSTCCQGAATTCNPAGLCCEPNCAGRQCGPDGCGNSSGCGVCPDGQTCNGNGQCVCTPQSCPNGCCDASGRCQPGNTNPACGDGGATCASCATGQTCQDQRCAACTPDCAGKACGPDGCGGSCGACADGQRCVNGQCFCDEQSCPNGCCANGPGNPGACRPGNTSQNCGTDGRACQQCTAFEQCDGGACTPATCAGQCTQDNDCPDLRNCVCNLAQGTCCARNCAGKVCGSDGCGGTCENLCPPNTVCNQDGTACLCTAQSCPNGCCSNGLGNPGECAEGDTNEHCGRPGESCQTCTGREQCQNNQCVCIPLNCDDLTSECGTFSDGCGHTLECGTCPDPEFPSCFVGVCVPCSIACPNCPLCFNLTSGNTVCSSDDGIELICDGTGCSSNAICTDGVHTQCVASMTDRPTNVTTTAASLCPNPGITAICGLLDPC